MKVYVPILIAQGTYEFDVPDTIKDKPTTLSQAIDFIKENKTYPTSISINTVQPNFDAARLTPEIHRNYDKSNGTN